MNAQFYLTYIRHFFGQPGELARLAEGAEGGRKSCQRVRVVGAKCQVRERPACHRVQVPKTQTLTWQVGKYFFFRPAPLWLSPGRRTLLC